MPTNSQIYLNKQNCSISALEAGGQWDASIGQKIFRKVGELVAVVRDVGNEIENPHS